MTLLFLIVLLLVHCTGGFRVSSFQSIVLQSLGRRTLHATTLIAKAARRHSSPETAPASCEGDFVQTVGEIDGVLREYQEEFVKLRGTAELVDRLENLVSKHPGIEV